MEKILSILLVWSIFLPIPALAANGTAADQQVRIRRAGDRFFLELCGPKKDCKKIGRESGYSRLELERWKSFRVAGWKDNLPLMGIIGALSAWVVTGTAVSVSAISVAPGAAALFCPPVAATAAAGILIFGGVVYVFSRHPQIKAAMPNDVYYEFSARPELLGEFKEFLRELDEGRTYLNEPRVLSGPNSPSATTDAQ